MTGGSSGFTFEQELALKAQEFKEKWGADPLYYRKHTMVEMLLDFYKEAERLKVRK